MDSKKPKKEPEIKSPEARAPSGRARPVLTERQRAEARRQRQKGRKRQSKDTGNVLSRGMRATGSEISRTFLFLGRSVLSALDFLRPVGGIIVSGLLAAVAFIGSGLLLLRRGIGVMFKAIGRIILAIDHLVTPARAIAFVALVAGGLLVASQFIEYRAIEIGQPGYVAVESIANAPRVEQLNPTDSHSLLLVFAGVAAVLAAGLSFITMRRQAGIVMAAAGMLTVVIAIGLDLPKALDVKVAELSYAGVKAILLSGFWLQLGAGAVLAVTGLTTLLSPRSARAPARRPSRSRRTPVGSQA